MGQGGPYRVGCLALTVACMQPTAASPPSPPCWASFGGGHAEPAPPFPKVLPPQATPKRLSLERCSLLAREVLVRGHPCQTAHHMPTEAGPAGPTALLSPTKGSGDLQGKAWGSGATPSKAMVHLPLGRGQASGIRDMAL